MKEPQELMEELLDNAHTPALSLSWCENNVCRAVAQGNTNILTHTPVDTNTLFQAASLSKPVSAAIILDLVSQVKWDLDTPLAEIAEYGPPELKQDPHYEMLTTRMIIGQCSGLANYGQDGDDGTKFIAEPNTRFTYSGVALDFLKQVVEQKTGQEWEDIAQDFFKKAGMKNSTFQRPSIDTHSNIAKAHEINPLDGTFNPLPILVDTRGVLAGGMLTNAKDYIVFLQYCFNNEYLKSTLLSGVLSQLPPTLSPETSDIQWGLGMGIYSTHAPENSIAFHWGNNTGSISFCALDMNTGNCIACFSNSMNGPSVFQRLTNSIVGEVEPLFQWLSMYCGFKDLNAPKAMDTISTTIDLIHLSAHQELQDKNAETTKQLRMEVQQIKSEETTSLNTSLKTSCKL